MASVPVALWNLKVPAGGGKVPGYDDEEGAPLPYRITMAAIDSSTPSTKPSTLKLHKRVVTAVSDDENEDEDMDDTESIEEEFVICTLEPGKVYQQALDITMPEEDEIYFSASGDLPIYLTGNYVTPLNVGLDSESEYEDDEDEDEDEYDLSPDEDELLLEGESEEDELDDLDGRIEEVTEEETKVARKGTKRPRQDSEEAPQLVDTAAKPNEPDTSKLSKSQKKKLKKQKLLSSEAEGAADANGTEKKVQFAPTLEEGPTPSKAAAAVPAKSALSPQAKSDSKQDKKQRTLANGVVIEDHKAGQGPKAKNGSKLGIRYIGKLAKSGKVFDKNTKGKPFRFTLGKGEVIKGWDIGLEGIQLGGERKINIPAAMAYGSQRIPDIPPNSDLIFDVKCVNID